MNHQKQKIRALFLGAIVCLAVSLRADEAAPKAAPETAAPQLTPGKQMFQPMAIDPILVRQSMQARSEHDDLNRRILARQTYLYESTPRLSELQEQMRAIQKKIDQLMEEDAELAELKKKLQEITPGMPMGALRPVAPEATQPVAPQKP